MPLDTDTLVYRDRTEQIMLATPRSFSAQKRLLVIAIFTDAHDDGRGIELNMSGLAELTGLPVERVEELVGVLREQGYLVPDGYYTLDAENNKVRHPQERFVVEKLIAAKEREAARIGARS